MLKKKSTGVISPLGQSSKTLSPLTVNKTAKSLYQHDHLNSSYNYLINCKIWILMTAPIGTSLTQLQLFALLFIGPIIFPLFLYQIRHVAGVGIECQ